MAADAENVDRDPERVDDRLSRDGGVSYLHIPAIDARQSARFYERVFGWKVSGLDSPRPSFEDGTGHVNGAWVTNQVPSTEPGLLPYIYVDDIGAAVQRIKAEGAGIVVAPYSEGNLFVATFRDPAGNVIGLWQAA